MRNFLVEKYPKVTKVYQIVFFITPLPDAPPPFNVGEVILIHSKWRMWGGGGFIFLCI